MRETMLLVFPRTESARLRYMNSNIQLAVDSTEPPSCSYLYSAKCQSCPTAVQVIGKILFRWAVSKLQNTRHRVRSVERVDALIV